MRWTPLALVGLVTAAAPARRVSLDRLEVTEGTVAQAGEWLAIDAPKVRAVATSGRDSEVALRFRYLGPSADERPLASGELRRQIALKLRAADGCNVVYASWRLAPRAGVVVQVKHNPGQHESEACGNGGYRTVRPTQAGRVPDLAPGSEHVLRAGIAGETMRVWIDGATVWSGVLPPEAFGFDGPVGVRTDNVRIRFELLTR